MERAPLAPPLVEHREAIARLCREFGVERLEVFGSAADGRFDPERSDIDLIVTLAPDPTRSLSKRYFALADQLELLFGRHVWDCAQHADLWGRRLPELRSPAQESEPANDGVVAFMDLLESREAPAASAERVTGVYRVLKPHLIAVYRHHLADANGIYEPPTRRIGPSATSGG